MICHRVSNVRPAGEDNHTPLLTPQNGAPTHRPGGRVAQLVEHLTFNQVVLGSSPSALTKEIKGFSLVLPFLASQKSLIGKQMGITGF